MKTKRRQYKFDRYIFGILLAMEVIMSFTFLGYVHIPPISATTAFIPIVVAACLFGSWEAVVTGLFFGLGSMFKASALYVMPDDRLFSPFHSGAPLQSLLLSVGSRVLFGLMIGLLYRAARAGRLKRLWKSLLALAAPGIYAFFVYSALRLMFPEYSSSYSAAFRLTANDIFLSFLCGVCVMACDAVYSSRRITEYRSAINNPEGRIGWSLRLHPLLSIITIFVLCVAVCATVYFSNRTKYMLTVQGIDVSDDILHDILLLQVQFLLSVLALCTILLMVILIVYRYMKHREYMGEMDALTGVMGRRLFLSYCTKVQQNRKPADSPKGWFLFLDVDYFKQINDTLGHTVGDETLKQVAVTLQNTFGSSGAVGRVGGDEFAVMINQEMSSQELARRLDQFLADISTILPQRTVSCSIGAYHFVFPQEINHLLSETDQVLYQAKASGRACFIIQD